ncbi:MAG: hypothetical protein EXR69_00710 [Myxococcales bacterium]|nr:hypothetical protein [Myxococcales bacterium]
MAECAQPEVSPSECLSCGACCREAYHAVEIGPRDAFIRLHPGWTQVDPHFAGAGRRRIVKRVATLTGTRCACLGDSSAGPVDPLDYRCVVYADRPKTCREFEQGSVNCADARRRVGLAHLPVEPPPQLS